MSINVTTLKGTNSIASDRITINDNFDITKDAINDILGIVDTTTGKFDNTGVGANSTITTEGLTITLNGLEIQGATAGNISIQNGYIKLATNGNYIELGSAGSKIKDNVVAGATAHIADLSDGFVGVAVPQKTTVELAAIALQLTPFGATGPNMIAFDTDVSKFKGWNGTAFVDLS